MSSKLIFYEKFNENCDAFFRDLLASFPNIEQFKYIRSGVNVVKNLDIKSPQRIFNTYVSDKYRDYILTKNEEFFLNADNIDIPGSRKEYWMEFIKYLRTIWVTLDTDNKEVIWKYFHVLLILSDKCQESISK
jgi:hypothetical protein